MLAPGSSLQRIGCGGYGTIDERWRERHSPGKSGQEVAKGSASKLAFPVTLWLHRVSMPEPLQPVLDLRPLGLGELLDRTFTLYRNNFFLFCGIMAIPETVIILAGVVFGMVTRNTIRPFPIVPQNPPPDPMQAFSGMGATFGAAMLIDLVYGLIHVAAICATTFAVAAVYLGKSATIRGAYQKIRGRVGALLGLCALLFIIIFAVWLVILIAMIITAALAAALASVISPIFSGILIFLVVVGALALAVWILMRFSLSIPVLLLENRSAVDSMARSGSLTAGHRGRVFLGIVVISAIVVGITSAIVAPATIPFMLITIKGSFMPAWLVIAQALSSGIAGTLTGPLLSIALALIYYDVRIRKEAYDLEVMAASAPRAAEIASAPPATGPAPIAP
jgi:hypothetical protein